MEKNKDISIFMCGSSTEKCKCLCPDGSCGHVWDGPVQQLTSIDKDGNPYMSGETATCSKCGMSAIDHDVWVGP